MVLELHVWGPGFGLPSIDAGCLATIAVCREYLATNSWFLVPAGDPAVSPLRELPALKNGDLWVSGFKNIVTYLKETVDEEREIDGHLDSHQSADCIAFTSFLESRGIPLLDLLLYVSPENYNASMKPTLGNILLWPNSWVLPSKLRDRAKKRSEHLGLSSLDVDTLEDDKSKDEGLIAQIPASLRKPKHTVSSFLGRDMRKNKFRMDAVNSDFLEPLDEMLSQNQWLFGDDPSSADCLAIAILSLMCSPTDLPHPWLKNTIDQKHPRLANWAHRHSTTWFGKPSLSGASTRQQVSKSELPWQKSPVRSWQNILNTMMTDVVELIPKLGTQFTASEVQTSSKENHTSRQREKQVALSRLGRQQLQYNQLLLSVLSLSTLSGILWWKGILAIPPRSPAPRFRSFGEAGSILGLG